MGNNAEIRKRMEIYRKVLLAIVWIVACIGLIAGLTMADSYSGGTMGIVMAFGSIIIGIIFHFLVNVALAIPFILLNNGDILTSLAGNGINTNEETDGGEITQILVNQVFVAITETAIRGSPEHGSHERKRLNVGDTVYFKSINKNDPTWYYMKSLDSIEGWCFSKHFEKC